jgi:alpha-beta hydrolase superfamily lysophospholipase
VTRLLAVLLLSSALAHAAPPVETRQMTLAEEATAVDLYLPDASSPRGLVVIAHGFTRSRARHVVLARRLADQGFFVAVPDLPYWTRAHGNADAIVDLVKAVETERGLDALPVVLIGTSAGGLASLIATDRVPRLALWVGLDPVDTLGVAETAARNLQVPAVVIRGPSSPCNAGGSAKRIAGWLANLRTDLRIDEASHCDFEDSTTARCETFCGASESARRALIVDAAVKAVTGALPARAADD